MEDNELCPIKDRDPDMLTDGQGGPARVVHHAIEFRTAGLGEGNVGWEATSAAVKLDSMAALHSSHLTLRFFGDTLDTGEITRWL